MSKQRCRAPLVLTLFGVTACVQALGLDDLQFSNDTRGAGGDDTATGGVSPAGRGNGGDGGRADPGGGGDGGDGGDGGGGAAGRGNVPPCISAFRDMTVIWGAAVPEIPFAISDPDTPVTELVLSAVSDNPMLAPSDEIVISGSGELRFIKPRLYDHPGPATITVGVSDGEFESSSSFELAATHAPVIDGLFDMGSVKNVPLNLAFLVNDDHTDTADIAVTVTSSNTMLVPSEGINPAPGNASFTLTPAAGQIGSSIITVTAVDADDNRTEGSFELTVIEAPMNGAELVSRAPGAGPIGNAGSARPSLSSDGRYVAFWSTASNLVPNDGAGSDVFVWNRLNDSIKRVSSGVGDSDGAVISGDAKTVAIQTNAQMDFADDDAAMDVYVVDLETDLTELASLGDNDAPPPPGGGTFGPRPALSSDGNFVAFSTNLVLVAEDDNNRYDVYVRDRMSATTTRVSVSTNGEEAGDTMGGQVSISADGGLVAFESAARNLIDGVTDPDGNFDIFLREGNDTRRLSQNPETREPANGHSRNPVLSADGKVVVFESTATNLLGCADNPESDIFAYNLATDTIELVSVPSDELPAGCRSTLPAVSKEGRYVVFDAYNPNTTVSSEHVYVRDRMTGTTKRVDRSYSGHLPNNYAVYPAISADGGVVALSSPASNIVLFDNNGTDDVFVVPRP